MSASGNRYRGIRPKPGTARWWRESRTAKRLMRKVGYRIELHQQELLRRGEARFRNDPFAPVEEWAPRFAGEGLLLRIRRWLRGVFGRK